MAAKAAAAAAAKTTAAAAHAAAAHATHSAAALTGIGTDIGNANRLQTLNERIGIHPVGARLQARPLGGRVGEHDSPVFDGVFDRDVGEFHDDLQCLAKRDIAQRRIDRDADLLGDVDLIGLLRLRETARANAEGIVRVTESAQ